MICQNKSENKELRKIKEEEPPQAESGKADIKN